MHDPVDEVDARAARQLRSGKERRRRHGREPTRRRARVGIDARALDLEPRRERPASRPLDPVVERDHSGHSGGTRRRRLEDRPELARRNAGTRGGTHFRHRRVGDVAHERVRDGGVRRGRVAHKRVGHRGIGDRTVRHGRIRDGGIRERRIDRSRVGGRGVGTRVRARVRERAGRHARAVRTRREHPTDAGGTRRALAGERRTARGAEPPARRVDAPVAGCARDRGGRRCRANQPGIHRRPRVRGGARVGGTRVGQTAVCGTGVHDSRVESARICGPRVRGTAVGRARVRGARVDRSAVCDAGVQGPRIGRARVGEAGVGRIGVRRSRVGHAGVRRAHSDESASRRAEKRDRRGTPRQLNLLAQRARRLTGAILDAAVLELVRRRVADENRTRVVRRIRVTETQGPRSRIAARSHGASVDGAAGRTRLLGVRAAAHVERRHHGNAAQETGEPDARQAIPLHVPLLLLRRFRTASLG